jgi:Protein of unknown function (DUF2948)
MTLLKLIALEPADLTIVSAHLQDAVIKVGDMTFAQTARDTSASRFVALGNRLVRAADARSLPERRRTALRIDRVTSAKIHGFTPSDRSTVLAILALTFTPDPDPTLAPAGILTIVCAGNASLRFDVECVELVLEDLGPAWQASAVPEHSGN